MLLIDKLKQARKNVKPEDFEEDSFIDVCSDPTEYGLSGTTETIQDSVCPVDIDPEDPSIFDSVSNHNNEMIHKRWESEGKFKAPPAKIIQCPNYDIKEEHVQEGDHVVTKRTCLGVIDSNSGKTISLEDAKKPGGILDSWTKYLESIGITYADHEALTTTEAPDYDEALCTLTPKYEECNSTEDTSGNTKSNVTDFLEKYAEGNDAIQVLRYDLMKILSDIHWIKESGNENEQFSLDFADALNEISVSI